MKKPQPFLTEAALCAAFIAAVQRDAGSRCRGTGVIVPNWTAYAETAGWDILLVGEDGTQIGIEAKLKFNMKVLQQAVPASWDAWRDTGPDYRAVLVPEGDEGAEKLCSALGVMLIRHTVGGEFSPDISMHHWNGGWHYWSPRQRCPLPEFVPDVAAGASAPVQLTKWKIAALRVIARLELRGHVTCADFKELSLDPRRWVGPNGWLTASTATPGQFVRGPNLDFDQQHPTVYAQVLAEARSKVKPAEVLL